MVSLLRHRIKYTESLQNKRLSVETSVWNSVLKHPGHSSGFKEQEQTAAAGAFIPVQNTCFEFDCELLQIQLAHFTYSCFHEASIQFDLKGGNAPPAGEVNGGLSVSDRTLQGPYLDVVF